MYTNAIFGFSVPKQRNDYGQSLLLETMSDLLALAIFELNSDIPICRVVFFGQYVGGMNQEQLYTRLVTIFISFRFQLPDLKY